MGTATEVVYKSAESKTAEQACYYLQTHHVPHRYLAYKDVPPLIHQFVKGKQALDFGTGTGASAAFLHDLGLEVIGTDISPNMLKQAQSNLPHIKFYSIDSLIPTAAFDLVFSSFVLFELSCKEDIIHYLLSAASHLREGGIFIGITGSECLYDVSRKWMSFDTNFQENRHLNSGDVARLSLKHPKMEFHDYFWKRIDYLNCFDKTCLKIVQLHSPLGSSNDLHPWRDELFFSPFTIFVARKMESETPV